MNHIEKAIKEQDKLFNTMEWGLMIVLWVAFLCAGFVVGRIYEGDRARGTPLDGRPVEVGGGYEVTIKQVGTNKFAVIHGPHGCGITQVKQ